MNTEQKILRIVNCLIVLSWSAAFALLAWGIWDKFYKQ